MYLVYRIPFLPLRCTDLVGKVGKGKGKRKDVYRTPYGSDNLHTQVWDCKSEKEALELEGMILNLLDLLGWLRYHASQKRSEVISFPFKGKTQQQIVSEYTFRMKWILSLVSLYHKKISNQEEWSVLKDMVTSLKGKMVDGKISSKNLSLCNKDILFPPPIYFDTKGDTVSISFEKKKSKGCCLM